MTRNLVRYEGVHGIAGHGWEGCMELQVMKFVVAVDGHC